MALTPSEVDKSDDSADSMVEKGINFGGLEEAFCAKEGSYDVRDMLLFAFCARSEHYCTERIMVGAFGTVGILLYELLL